MTESFTLFEHQRQLVHAPWIYRDVSYFFMIGGYGCVHPDTLIETPTGHVAIKDFQGGLVYSWDGGSKVAANARRPVMFGKEPMIRITTDNGSSVMVTPKHLFMTNYSWHWAEQLIIGQSLLTPSGQWTEVISIQAEPPEHYYDLHVPFYNNYFANGLLSHNCGKSSSVVFFIFNICRHYLGRGHVEVAIGVPTITLFDKTIWVDLRKYLEMSKSAYTYNKQEHVLTIGNITFIVINTEEPGRIYGVNPMIFICDELDELAQDVAMEAWVAINERTRNMLPDGRKPFMVFTTTAQGYKGTYQILETLKMQNAELKEQLVNCEISQDRYNRLHNKWIHIRALTKNNTHLDPDYVDRLYLRYDENERLAFLEGHFVNLTTGRVYPEYDSAIHDIEPFPVDPSETVYIGQDLNVGFSKAVAFIKRDSSLYIVKCFSFKTIVDAPYLMRSTFPTNPIEYFPDASANEILAMPDYRRELLKNNIQMRSGTVNPSILQRTFIQNKLLKMKRMFIFKSKDNQPMMMALKVRQFDDKGVPEKGRGSEAPDHLCFHGDTLVLTNRGRIPIKYVDTNDYAMTRYGYKPILFSGKTGEDREVVLVETLNGLSLKCTPEHKIWSEDRLCFIEAIKLVGLESVRTLRGTDLITHVTILEERTDVYDITVEEVHELFADGILSANCDSSDYAVYRIVNSDPNFRDLKELAASIRTGSHSD